MRMFIHIDHPKRRIACYLLDKYRFDSAHRILPRSDELVLMLFYYEWWHKVDKQKCAR